jgi:hypothetical protein
LKIGLRFWSLYCRIQKMSDPAFAVLPAGGTLTVSTPLGTVTLVEQDGEITFYVPPTVKIISAPEKP